MAGVLWPAGHSPVLCCTQARIEALKKQFGVSGIPWLVILDKEGNLVLNEADETIGKGTVAYQEWLAKASTGANSPMAR